MNKILAIDPGFQSTLPLRGATIEELLTWEVIDISIHAPLAGSDVDNEKVNNNIYISIHAPLAGSDMGIPYKYIFRKISIHAPLAGSDNTPPQVADRIKKISIHAPLAGSDSKSAQKLSIFHDFCPKHVPISETRLSTIHEFSKFYLPYIVNYCLYPVRKNLQKYVSSPFAPENLQYRYHNIKIPSGSYDFFAPMCSILLLYLSPIK